MSDNIYADDRFEDIELVAPHSPEAEVALLGSLILDEDVINEVSRKITPKDFYLKRHQRIYEAMLELANEGANIDYVILDAMLKKKHQNDEAWGGLEYLTELPRQITYIPSVSNYIDIIKKHSLRRALIKLSRQIIEKAYDRTQESKDVLEMAHSEILKQCTSTIDKDPVSMREVMREVVDDMKEKNVIDIKTIGLPTGIAGLDELTLGLRDGNLITIGGRASMGKTSLMLSIVRHIGTVEQKSVLILSAEMGSFEVGQNALAEISKVNLTALQLGATNDRENESIGEHIGKLAAAPIFIDDTSELTIMRVKTLTRKFIKEQDIKAVFIDYLQLMTHQRTSHKSSNADDISETARQLKSLAKEVQIPVVVLAQINRQVEHRQGAKTVYKPRMSELKGSGGIEEHSDVVILIHRESYYTHKREDIGKDVLIIAKNRRGRTGEAPVRFIPEYVRFEHRVVEESNYMDDFKENTTKEPRYPYN